MAAARSSSDEDNAVPHATRRDAGVATRTITRSSTLITCYNSQAQQLSIPNAALGEAFTGLQKLTHEIVRLNSERLDPDAMEVTLMRVGPSAFDLQTNIKVANSGFLSVLVPPRTKSATRAVLDRATTLFGAVGEAGMLLAAHPGCELRFVETSHGADVEILVNQLPRLILPAPMLETVRASSIQEALRMTLVPLLDPEFSYVTIRGELQGVKGLANQVMESNEHLRAFVHGAQLKPKSFEPTQVIPSPAQQQWDRDRN